MPQKYHSFSRLIKPSGSLALSSPSMEVLWLDVSDACTRRVKVFD
jgi:hypothetical protein